LRLGELALLDGSWSRPISSLTCTVHARSTAFRAGQPVCGAVLSRSVLRSGGGCPGMGQMYRRPGSASSGSVRFLRCRSDESEGWVVGAGRNSHPPQTRPRRASRSTGTRSLTAIVPTHPSPACNAVFVVSPGSRGRRLHGFQAAGPFPQHACERDCKQSAPSAEIHETAGLHEALGWQTSVPASTFRNGINMPSRRVSA
jgi:hypothetical protein